MYVQHHLVLVQLRGVLKQVAHVGQELPPVFLREPNGHGPNARVGVLEVPLQLCALDSDILVHSMRRVTCSWWALRTASGAITKQDSTFPCVSSFCRAPAYSFTHTDAQC